MNISRKFIATTIAIASLAGIGSYAVASSKTNAQNLIAVSEVPVTHDQAVGIALQVVPGTVIGSELEHDDEPMLWEVEIVDATGQAFELEIDATTGEVLTQEAADIDDDDDDDDDHEKEGPESEIQNTN